MNAHDVPTAVLECATRPAFELRPKTLAFFTKDRLPQKAGIAELVFSDAIRQPLREQNLIALPAREGELVYHHLKGGMQFLVEVAGHAYFGGTDDNPNDNPNVFLTEVTTDAIEIFRGGTEIDFFESLKPVELRELENADPSSVTRRQGDIFAFWSPAFGETVQTLIGKTLKRQGVGHEITLYAEMGVRLTYSTTRHTVCGRYIKVSVKLKSVDTVHEIGYFTGDLAAPDHKSLKLGNRPHRLFQATNLIHPRPGCGDR